MSLYRKLLLRMHPFKTLKDEYLTRMRTSIAGESMLHEGNIFALNYTLQRLPPKGAVLEIGSFAGMSANVISWLMRKNQVERPFFTCDPWVYNGYHDHIKSDDPLYMKHFEGSDSITREEFTRFIRDSFVRNCLIFSKENTPQALPLRSDSFFEHWQTGAKQVDVFSRTVTLGGPLALVYIDGDHGYEVARNDVEQSLKWLEPGGFMLLDDSADFLHYGCSRLAKEMRHWKNIRLVMKNPHYLYQKK